LLLPHLIHNKPLSAFAEIKKCLLPAPEPLIGPASPIFLQTTQVISRGTGMNYPQEREKSGPGTTATLKIRAVIALRGITSPRSGEALPCPESRAIFVRNGSI